jgi:hypothetical protein
VAGRLARGRRRQASSTRGRRPAGRPRLQLHLLPQGLVLILGTAWRFCVRLLLVLDRPATPGAASPRRAPACAAAAGGHAALFTGRVLASLRAREGQGGKRASGKWHQLTHVYRSP